MNNRIFYHIYPFGLLGAPKKNDFNAKAVNRLEELLPWLDHIKNLGCDALYLGPVFESTSHGYDTADYFQVDRRLGTIKSLQKIVSRAHDLGIKVVLDAVFNHVGRDFWAFQDLRKNGHRSKYKDWFSNVDFSEQSPLGDAFTYEAWNGHFQLVEFNLRHPAVRAHLFSAVIDWIDRYKIDGLRLDAADVMDFGFLEALSTICKSKNLDFWLMGEVVQGDYNCWVKPKMLDSVTNYDYHTPFYESFNLKDFRKIAKILQRQYGPKGIYKHFSMYSFVDNHDVDRAASVLYEPAHLYPLYMLLFTLPGIPAIYYGSEWGFEGRKKKDSDEDLRPRVLLDDIGLFAKHPLLIKAIKTFIALRGTTNTLNNGSYHELLVANEQFVFARKSGNDFLIIAVNASMKTAKVKLALNKFSSKSFKDLLNDDFMCNSKNGWLALEIPPCWGLVLAPLD